MADLDASATGLSEAVIEKIRHALAQFPEIERAVLYGSRAKGTFRPGSDIDIALMAPHLLDSTLSRIEIELDDLLLPYTIDLCRFESLQNPDLIEHIQRVGRTLYSVDR